MVSKGHQIVDASKTMNREMEKANLHLKGICFDFAQPACFMSVKSGSGYGAGGT